MTRTEKWQWLRDSLKKEAESIEQVLLYETSDYTELFDDMMGNPMQQLEDMLPRVYRKEDMLCR